MVCIAFPWQVPDGDTSSKGGWACPVWGASLPNTEQWFQVCSTTRPIITTHYRIHPWCSLLPKGFDYFLCFITLISYLDFWPSLHLSPPVDMVDNRGSKLDWPPLLAPSLYPLCFLHSVPLPTTLCRKHCMSLFLLTEMKFVGCSDLVCFL